MASASTHTHKWCAYYSDSNNESQCKKKMRINNNLFISCEGSFACVIRILHYNHANRFHRPMIPPLICESIRYHSFGWLRCIEFEFFVLLCGREYEWVALTVRDVFIWYRQKTHDLRIIIISDAIFPYAESKTHFSVSCHRTCESSLFIREQISWIDCRSCQMSMQ